MYDPLLKTLRAFDQIHVKKNADRPKNPIIGQPAYNSITGMPEWWDGKKWNTWNNNFLGYYMSDEGLLKDEGHVFYHLLTGTLWHCEEGKWVDSKQPFTYYSVNQVNPDAQGNINLTTSQIPESGDALYLRNEDRERWNNKEDSFKKNTAFNKDFGDTAGTVAMGNHSHNYMPFATTNSAYNCAFDNNGISELVSRSDHQHKDYALLSGDKGVNFYACNLYATVHGPIITQQIKANDFLNMDCSKLVINDLNILFDGDMIISGTDLVIKQSVTLENLIVRSTQTDRLKAKEIDIGGQLKSVNGSLQWSGSGFALDGLYINCGEVTSISTQSEHLRFVDDSLIILHNGFKNLTTTIKGVKLHGETEIPNVKGETQFTCHDRYFKFGSNGVITNKLVVADYDVQDTLSELISKVERLLKENILNSEMRELIKKFEDSYNSLSLEIDRLKRRK